LALPQPAAAAPKRVWRAWAKIQRAALPVHDLSQKVAARLLSWPEFQRAGNVLSYLAFGSEMDLSPLFVLGTGKAFYLTRTPAAGRMLTVHRFTDMDGLEPHPYGYLQPPPEEAAVEADTIDLALVPGLCFDRHGIRLGYGRGYYDRLLRKLRPDVPRVGVTAEALFVEHLPSEPSDVLMTHIVTAARLAVVAREDDRVSGSS
jgi:5-formyltetrahydrofolate cyclo-ligase